MATMNIKDPAVHRLAHALARQRQVSATRAVREALEEALQRDREQRSGIGDRLMEIAAQSQAVEAAMLTDEDLYDEDGLPR
ncbi:type II toxin-antitoxin system VapB family antitoxin [Ornithinicoccus hortensis]|uniref:Antitoxin VapB n=1 Tax=Ornithinicoccus hortensis TaxID=82346 RepID=A0A542YV41_9MICO|nr:type II toxin-antitoxin system VapB family antitoxin [Ornithinicoccus hortensis]TQL51824.1 antitoxin VapB [Ornithinicoccus hortensis]